MASIKEVAQKAGVGVGTVSRVLNSTGYVSDETRIKVETAMKELNYIPNELARNLLSKKSGIVAIIIPKISHPFFAEVVLYAEAELMKKGYKTMICSTYSEQNYEKEYINMLNRHIVDGIIAGSHMLDFEEYQGVQGPIVALDRFWVKIFLLFQQIIRLAENWRQRNWLEIIVVVCYRFKALE